MSFNKMKEGNESPWNAPVATPKKDHYSSNPRTVHEDKVAIAQPVKGGAAPRSSEDKTQTSCYGSEVSKKVTMVDRKKKSKTVV